MYPDPLAGLLLHDVDPLTVVIVPLHGDEIGAALPGVAQAADDLEEMALRLGDGGAVVTDSRRVADRIRLARDGGRGENHVSLAVGVVISILQATTQIQEQTLSYVPKLVTVFLSIAILGPWMLRQAVQFTQSILNLIVVAR